MAWQDLRLRADFNRSTANQSECIFRKYIFAQCAHARLDARSDKLADLALVRTYIKFEYVPQTQRLTVAVYRENVSLNFACSARSSGLI